MDYCVNCGTRLEDDGPCPSCQPTSPPQRGWSQAAGATISHPRQLPTPPQPNQQAGSRSALLWLIPGAALVLSAVIALGAWFVYNNQQSPAPVAGQPTALPLSTDLQTPTAEPADPTVTTTRTVRPETVTATATVTRSVRPNVAPSAFVESLYQDWSARDSAAVADKVAPEYLNMFPQELLDSQGIESVTSFDNVEYGAQSSMRVCGKQLFTKSNGLTQVESRCFDVAQVGGEQIIVWTGNQDTVREWS